ncbi:MAG: 4-hydroxy-tetrahydrodipicolinate reductase [Mariprofundales bacterium]
MMRVAIVGASGRMGRMLVRAVHENDNAKLVVATERPNSSLLETDAGELAGIGALGVCLSSGLQEKYAMQIDAIIDFTAPQASLRHAAFAAKHGIAFVLGTTGFDENAMRQLRTLCVNIPTVMAANYSVGVNLSLALAQQAAAILDDDYDIEIHEAHHRFKVDAPSGTALALGKAVADGREVDLDEHLVPARHGITGARKTGDIGFSVTRAGDIVGEHTVLFAGMGERIEIKHIATDRMCFARGAVRAALWLQSQPAQWYGMHEVLAQE